MTVGMLLRSAAAAILLLIVPALPASANGTQLVMIEEHGCMWCEQWNKEIGVVYHKTTEGRRAPLRRVDMHEPLPADLKFLVKGGYTPTFVLVHDGREIGRIRGYPGEDFFWGLLQQLLKKLPRKQAARTTTGRR